MARVGEREWVASLAPRLEVALQPGSTRDAKVRVEASRRLRYAHEVLSYKGNEPTAARTSGYQTDLLVFDEISVFCSLLFRTCIHDSCLLARYLYLL